MKRVTLLSALLLSALVPAAVPAKPLLLAKVSADQATAIATKARPGRIVATELEREKGGSGLRYSFDIKGTDAKVYEVGVDALTGAVLENSGDKPN